MFKNKLKGLILALVIVVLGLFQAYWIIFSYHTQAELLSKKINIAFKESINQVERSIIKADVAQASELLSSLIPNYKPSYYFNDSTNQTLQPNINLLRVEVLDSVFKQIVLANELNDIQYNVIQQSKEQHLKPISSNQYFISDAQTTIKGKHIVFYVVVKNFHQLVIASMINQIIVSIIALIVLVVGGVFTYKIMMSQKQLVSYKNDFVTTISHELKTPLSSIGIAIEAITKYDGYNDKALTFRYLQASSEELKRLNLLIDRVLKLSAFEHAKIALQSKPCNLYSLIHDVLQTMQPYLQKMEVTIRYPDNQQTNKLVWADEVHLKSVFFNLIDNAIKYSNHPIIVEINITEQDDNYIISVKDNGIGIPKAYQQKIFEKFYRVPQVKSSILGYGLGLSYVKHIMLLHKGDIKVLSQEKEGSEFIITLKKYTSNYEG